MGGSSSKQKKSKISGSKMASKRHSDGSLRLEQTTKSSNGKKKGTGKTGKNVQIQVKNSEDTSVPKIKKSISFSDKSLTQVTPPPVYRKKSMCHPCDAKDFEELRQRSGSDKSLRFSDFNKLVRQTTLFEWENAPADIPLYGAPVPRHQAVCYICGVYTGSVTRACRICYQVYHDGCLVKIGQALDKKARQRANTNSWSCHQCNLLSHLLTRADVHEILGQLQDLHMNSDGITLDDYYRYYETIILGPVEKASPAGFQSACEARYKEFDENNTGLVEFDNFLDMVAVHIITKRNQCSLVHILTEPELSKARTMYQQLDEKYKGQVTVEAAHLVIQNFDKNIKEIYRPKETCVAQTDDEKRSLMSWGSFVCLVSIHLLVQRPNYSLEIASLSGSSTIDKTQSFDSLDEAYKSCCSDLDSSTVQVDDQSRDNVENEEKKSVTMLEEFTSAFPMKSENMIQDSAKNEDKIFTQEYESDDSPCSTQTGSHLWKTNHAVFSKHPNFASPALSFSPEDSWDITTLKNKSPALDKADDKGIFSPTRDINRRSEILIRPPNEDRSQKRRAVSQKVIAPPFGRLVDRVQQEDWC